MQLCEKDEWGPIKFLCSYFQQWAVNNYGLNCIAVGHSVDLLQSVPMWVWYNFVCSWLSVFCSRNRGFLRVPQFPPQIKLTKRHNCSIVLVLLKVVLNTHNPIYPSIFNRKPVIKFIYFRQETSNQAIQFSTGNQW